MDKKTILIVMIREPGELIESFRPGVDKGILANYVQLATIHLNTDEAWEYARLIAERWLSHHYPPDTWEQSTLDKEAYIFRGGPSHMALATHRNPEVVVWIREVVSDK